MSVGGETHMGAFSLARRRRVSKNFTVWTIGGAVITPWSLQLVKRTKRPCARKHISVRPYRRGECVNTCPAPLRHLWAGLYTLKCLRNRHFRPRRQRGLDLTYFSTPNPTVVVSSLIRLIRLISLIKLIRLIRVLPCDPTMGYSQKNNPMNMTQVKKPTNWVKIIFL